LGNVSVWGLDEGLQRITININLIGNVTQDLVLGLIFWNVPSNGECTCSVDLGMWSLYVLRKGTLRMGLMGRLDFRWEKSGNERAEDDNTFYRKENETR